jgi:proteasome lid subunit RPN8/RPN11
MPPQAELLIPAAIWQAMLRHARDTLPAEAVGLLGGPPDGPVAQLLPLENLAGTRAFLADPWAQFQAERKLRAAELSPVAIYHSHPGGGSDPSTLDLVFALRWSIVHIIIALARPFPPVEQVKAYRLDDRTINEVRLRVAGD